MDLCVRSRSGLEEVVYTDDLRPFFKTRTFPNVRTGVPSTGVTSVLQ